MHKPYCSILFLQEKSECILMCFSGKCPKVSRRIHERKKKDLYFLKNMWYVCSNTDNIDKNFLTKYVSV